jgi:hypothetical protein
VIEEELLTELEAAATVDEAAATDVLEAAAYTTVEAAASGITKID